MMLIAAMSGAPDTVCRWVFIVFARPPTRYQTHWDYVSGDLCAEMPRADTEPALPAKRDATCHIGARDGEPGNATGSARLAGGGTQPPLSARKRLPVILSGEVRFTGKGHYHNGGRDAAERRVEAS